MVPVFWYKFHMSSSSASAKCLVFNLPAAGEYGVGMVFAHKYESLRNEQKRILEEVVREEGQVVLGWREVPVDGTKVGKEAAAIRPWMIQILIGKGPRCN